MLANRHKSSAVTLLYMRQDRRSIILKSEYFMLTIFIFCFILRTKCEWISEEDRKFTVVLMMIFKLENRKFQFIIQCVVWFGLAAWCFMDFLMPFYTICMWVLSLRLICVSRRHIIKRNEFWWDFFSIVCIMIII